MFLDDVRITRQENLGEGHFLLEVQSPSIAKAAAPGQFVHIRCAEQEAADPLLRRPISIHTFNSKEGTVTLYYLVVGRGTSWLSKQKPGERLSVMGPLGKGFDCEACGEQAVLVGGGMGIAPLLSLAERLHAMGRKVQVVLGAGTNQGLVRAQAFVPFAEVHLCTEDGSCGTMGLVTERLKAFFVAGKTTVYTCGPEAMMKAVCQTAKSAEVPCQVSLEATMACGVGACLGCTCVVDAKGGYPKVCKDGPVFWAEEVSF